MPTNQLQSAVYATFRKFGRVGASYPVYFNPPLAWEVVPAEELLSQHNLDGSFARAISEWSDRPGSKDQRAGASRFLRRYVGSLTAAALIPLAGGVALDLAIPRVQLLIRNDLVLGTVVDLTGATVYVSAERPTTWPIEAVAVSSTAELRAHALESLFGDHLVPAFDRVHAVVGVSWKLIWTTVAECVEHLYESARPYLDDTHRARLADDRAVIHSADAIPGIHGANPMKGLVGWDDFGDPDIPAPVHWRRVCCVNYLVRPYCRTCGLLPVEERHRLWRQYVMRQRKETSCRWPPVG